MPLRVLITAGPTREPIDAVRYIGNRSSGRLGIALATAAANRGWEVTLLLGPVETDRAAVTDSRLRVARFLTTDDLGALLERYQPEADLLILAAAVADFRPAKPATGSKLRRQDAGLTLRLEPTPDLAAGCVARRAPGQRIVAFALEPRDGLEAAAIAKMRRKGADLIVANPLETMDAPTVEATLLSPNGPLDRTSGAVSKDDFAGWLLDRLAPEQAP